MSKRKREGGSFAHGQNHMWPLSPNILGPEDGWVQINSYEVSTLYRFSILDDYLPVCINIILDTILNGKIQFSHGTAYNKEKDGDKKKEGQKKGQETSKEDSKDGALIYEWSCFLYLKYLYLVALGFVAVCSLKTSKIHKQIIENAGKEPGQASDSEADSDSDSEDEDEEEQEHEHLDDGYIPVCVNVAMLNVYRRVDMYHRAQYRYFTRPKLGSDISIELKGIMTFEDHQYAPNIFGRCQSRVSILMHHIRREMRNLESYDRYLLYSTAPILISEIPRITSKDEEDKYGLAYTNGGIHLRGENQVTTIPINQSGTDTEKGVGSGSNIQTVFAPFGTNIMIGGGGGGGGDDGDDDEIYGGTSNSMDNDQSNLASIPRIAEDWANGIKSLPVGSKLNKQTLPPAPANILEFISIRRELTFSRMNIPSSIEKNYSLGASSKKKKGDTSKQVGGTTVDVSNTGMILFYEHIKKVREQLQINCQVFLDDVSLLEREVLASLMNDDNKKARKEDEHGVPILFHQVKPEDLRITITFASTIDHNICFELYDKGFLKYDFLKDNFAHQFGIPMDAFELIPRKMEGDANGGSGGGDTKKKKKKAKTKTKKKKKKKKSTG